MCGIVGVYRFDGTPVLPHLLRQMTDLLVHRGPDAAGLWSDGSIGLGHRRLSIIDIEGSPQPMACPEGRYRTCFNGEILNYRSLRSRFTYPYRTAGDTETLLATYRARGADMVHELVGQFAFAVHDALTGELVLFRDRLGILPLYYYADEHMIAFASEIKGLLPALPHAPEVDTASLDAFLALRSVPAPHTMFRGIRKLPAGHRLRVGRSGNVRVERYWSIPGPAPTTSSPEEAVQQVTAALERAVSDAMVADVPVGAYLSGGVDSSLIVALMSAHGHRVETFAAAFGEHGIDERPHARRVSEALGTSHHEVVVAPSDFVDLWPTLSWHRDAPMSEPADFAVYRLAELARRHVTVVLSGEGSDELFAGYPKYRVGPWVERASVLPAALRAPAVRAVERRMPPAVARARIALRVLGASTAEERRRAWFAPFTETERAALVGRWGAHRPAAMTGVAGDTVRRMLATDCQGWLPDNLLERGDRMSMATSLELRPPFLDHRLVELAFALPTTVKIRNGVGKWVVKKIAERHLPADVVHRRKVGFQVPLEAWFRGELSTLAGDLLGSDGSVAAALTDRRSVMRLLDRHRSGRANEQARLWPLLCLEVWHDVFFRRPVPASASSGSRSNP